MATDLAAPDGDKGTGGTVRAAPGQDIAISRLDDGEDMTGALVCHPLRISVTGMRYWTGQLRLRGGFRLTGYGKRGRPGRMEGGVDHRGTDSGGFLVRKIESRRGVRVCV
jgi:hypothetical protein